MSWKILSRSIWKAGLTAKPTVIEDDVFLGCRVVLLGGVLVGGGAVVLRERS
jgi:acetyltransferase-like isoleucine patch superfamily enzyme